MANSTQLPTLSPLVGSASRGLRCGLLGWLSLAALFASGCASGGAFNSEGVKLYQAGQYPGAMQQFQQSVHTYPKDPDGYYNLASTMHKVGLQNNDQKALQQAETLYNQCLDLNDNQPDCYRGLAVLLCDTNRTDRAFKLLENWTTRNPRSGDARVELARLYEETGDSEKAKAQLQTALQLDPNNPRAWAAMGQMRDKAGDSTQALANYQRSLQLNHNQPAIAERVARLSSQPGVTPPVTPTPTMPGTRTVNQPSSPWRYQ